MITAAARAAILDSGLPGLLTLGGGSLQVRLINGTSEASGNGYSRQRFTEFELARNSQGQSLKSSIAVDFTASGGSIAYDRVEVYNRAGTTRYLRGEYLGPQTIASGTTREVQITFGTPEAAPYWYDFTKFGQLAKCRGRRPTFSVEIPQAYPWLLPDGSVFARDAAWLDGAEFPGPFFWDHEPEVLSTYSTGTIGIVNGAVTGSGTNFPNYGTNAVYYRQLHVNGVIYDVATRNSGTSLTLVDTSVNVPSGTAYKFAPWDYREVDPKYATNDGEWQGAQDEVAFAMADVQEELDAYGGQPGLYEFGIPAIWRRSNDIIDDADAGLYEEWLDNLDEASMYVTASGFRLVDFIKDRGGAFYWTSYVPNAYIGSTHNWNRWRLRNERIWEGLNDRGIPNIMMLLRHTQDVGFGQFLANTTAEEVPRELQALLIQDAHDRQPGSWGFWGAINSANVMEYRLDIDDDYSGWISETVGALIF